MLVLAVMVVLLPMLNSIIRHTRSRLYENETVPTESTKKRCVETEHCATQ